MKRKAFIFVNGVRTSATDQEEWHFRAERWVEFHVPGALADTFHYESSALFRWVRQSSRVKGCAEFIRKFMRPELEIIAVGHSNGCAVLADVMRENPDVVISELHLVAGACDADFERNGLNGALRRGQIREVDVYWSKDDKALRWARASWKALHWLGLGYGYLGLVGPKHATSNSTMCRVNSFAMDGFDHSTYWSAAAPRFGELSYFEKTMLALSHQFERTTA